MLYIDDILNAVANLFLASDRTSNCCNLTTDKSNFAYNFGFGEAGQLLAAWTSRGVEYASGCESSNVNL